MTFDTETATAPGLMDGHPRILVLNGKPLSAEGLALMKWYNAHPPGESEKPVGTFATVMAEKRARRLG